MPTQSNEEILRSDAILGDNGYRMNARASIRRRIEVLRRQADGLEALLKVLDFGDMEDPLTPLADEALWGLILRADRG